MKVMKRVVIYTDGSTKLHLPNKPGTCSYVVVSKQEVIHSKAFRYYNTTNNRMEIEGLYQALKYVGNTIGRNVEVVIYTDSTYVRDGLLKWIKNWKNNGWKTSEKKDVLNKDLWIKLDEVYTSMSNVQLEWCKGHSVNKWNNLADKLCSEAYTKAVREPEKPTTVVQEEKQRGITINGKGNDNYGIAPKEPFHWPMDEDTITELSDELKEANRLLVELYQNAKGIGWKADIVDTVEEYIIKNQLI